uniref:Uncharacterized protein n=1 Tax=Globisporangium ultimum (strain ATCC 200006 / CBS 805.95 / DAOM BR144) TaxID=431595 RepID=K3X6R2_GLOUD
MVYNKIMEREAYVVIFSELMDKVNQYLEERWNANVIVTGTEGAGLSRFYHHDKVKSLPSFDLVLNSRNEYHKYCASTKEFTLLAVDEANDISLKHRVIRLIEGDSSKLLGWRGVSILFAAEGLPSMHRYAKVDPYTYILPVWTLDELRALNSLLRDDLQLPEDALSARYY